MISKPEPARSTLTSTRSRVVLTCLDCRTSQHLEIEAIEALEPEIPGWMMAEYSCGACEGYYAHEVAVESLAKFLSITDAPAGVLKFGRHYIHCGEPMQEQEMKLTTVQAPGKDPENIVDVVLPSMVLKCRCGFQMSIPH